MVGPSIKGKYPVQFAKISTASSGATAVVAAVTDNRIRVLSVLLVAGASVSVKWQSAATDLTGLMAIASSGGYSQESEVGLFETAPSEALNINLSGNVQVSGVITYTLVPAKVRVSAADLS